MPLPLLPSAAPTSALAPISSSFRVLTEPLSRRGRCFQMRPDAEIWGEGWPLRAWRGGGGMKGGQEMSEEGV